MYRRGQQNQDWQDVEGDNGQTVNDDEIIQKEENVDTAVSANLDPTL